jgi:hypothetical protein
MKFFKYLVQVLLSLFCLQSFASEACLNMIPEIEAEFNNLKAVPGTIDSQIQINKEAQGLNRFEYVNEAVILMDAERFPIFSQKRKTIQPITSLEGLNFQGVHLATRTQRTYHRGVEIFDMQLSYNQNISANNNMEESNNSVHGPTQMLSMFDDPFLPYYFKNFELQPTPFCKGQH